jgi:hypothetical protein
MGRIESISEYLARGGKITFCKASSRSSATMVRSTAVVAARVLSLEEGSLYYGEKPKSRKKGVQLSQRELEVLPTDLRKQLGL